MLRRLILVVCFALVAAGAHAQDTADANWPNLVKTLVRFRAIDLTDTPIIDEYTIITECELYQSFFHDDFKWNKVREAVRQSVAGHIATFPTAFHYDANLQLERYDFASKIFRFTDKTALHNVNSFILFAVKGTACGDADIKYMPRIFRVVVPTPLYMDGLPLSESDGQALVKAMEADGNSNRVITARFNMHVTYIEPLRKNAANLPGEALETYAQSKSGDPRSVRIDAQMDSIEFYEDAEMRRLVYKAQF